MQHRPFVSPLDSVSPTLTIIWLLSPFLSPFSPLSLSLPLPLACNSSQSRG